MHHILVDFENVPHVDLSVIGGRSVSLTLLLGAQPARLDAALVEKMLEHAASVQLVRLTSPGKNAVDFALAYYLGRIVAADPTAHFHIVSKDSGFDPLIEHLRTRHLHARRHDDFTTLPFSSPAKPPLKAPETLASRFLDQLRKHPASRPKRKKTLVSHLIALSGHTATEADANLVIEELCQAGHVNIGLKDAVTYPL